VADEADHVAEESGVMPLSDRLSSVATLALGKLMRELATEAVSDSTKRDDFLRVFKELGRARRDDLAAARMRPGLELADAQRRNSRRFAAEASHH
jgi:hypothetical protein